MPTDNQSRWWRRKPSLTTPWRRPTDAASAAQADDKALVLSLSPKRIPSWKQLKFLPRLLSDTERTLIRASLSLALIAGLTFVGHQVIRHVIFVPADGGSITEGIIGSPQFINPVLARPFSADADLSKLVYRGLFRVDSNLKVVPDMAKAMTISDDGKVYTITLRSDVPWSDGQPLSSEDVRYTFETIADSNYQSPYQSVFKGVAITAPDAHTVVFTLPAPFEPFRSSLTLGILPAELWRDQTPQSFPLAELNVKPVGNGPYKFQSVTKDRSGLIKGFTFVRNKTYAGRRPHLDKLTVKFYTDAPSAIDALQSDAIDDYGSIDAAHLAKVQKERTVMKFGLSQLSGVFFNEKTNVALKAPEVRKALAMTVDRDSIIKNQLRGLARPAYGPLLPGQPGYSPDAHRITLDTAQANALLDQNGWTKGADGYRSKKNQALAFTLTTVDDPSFAPVAAAVASAWKDLGAKVEVKLVGADRFQKDVIKGRQYDALLFAQVSDPDADPFPIWHSSQQSDPGVALSVVYLKNADADIEKARSTTDAAAHDAALLDFQNIIADEVPAIFISQAEYVYAHQKSLRGFTSDSIVAPANRFDDVASWYVRTHWSWK